MCAGSPAEFRFHPCLQGRHREGAPDGEAGGGPRARNRRPGRRAMRYDDNLTNERPTFVTHLECAATGERHAADEIHNLSRAGKPLLVRYDLDGVEKALSKDTLAQ